ncbi:hypothetical protein [Sinorhizobium meliloti]|uniref:hypothetical protein n=1 Tax=Rhizobium meliloti TaxID=382 RepID=UPI001F1C5721|nr:hypothetical protein [Sinorhizobium meliloti]
MADSEISRTLPAITPGKIDVDDGAIKNLPYQIDRRNLLPVAARLLSARIAESAGKRRESGPTPVRELWPRWYAYHHHCARSARLRKKLAADMLQAAGGLPISELERVGDDGSVAVRSFAAMKSIAKLNVASEAELRERRKQWTEADQRLGYSAVAALEQELAEQAGILGRVMLIARPSSVIEVAAKLHCLIVTHDPGLKLEDTPWPELRTILKDLIRIAGTRNPKTSAGTADDAVETKREGSLRQGGLFKMERGKTASVRDILNLAAQYRAAAAKVGESPSRGKHLPQRLLALHAIELYLDALLQAKGHDHKTIREFQHDPGERARIAVAEGLVLRKRTLTHLATLSSSTEYLVVKYAPELNSTLSQVNRVMATLEEISRKVRKVVRAPKDL